MVSVIHIAFNWRASSSETVQPKRHYSQVRANSKVIPKIELRWQSKGVIEKADWRMRDSYAFLWNIYQLLDIWLRLVLQKVLARLQGFAITRNWVIGCTTQALTLGARHVSAQSIKAARLNPSLTRRRQIRDVETERSDS
jgi:hypothetical protein